MKDQIVMVSLGDLVPGNHGYRKFSKLWKFERIHRQLEGVGKDKN